MPKHVIWLTDVHFNFVEPAQVEQYLVDIAAEAPEAILLGGDIGEADSVVPYLEMMANRWTCPIYFVLGNHDYYRGSILGVREAVSELTGRIPQLIYLTEQTSAIRLTDEIGLIGHDGWADARVGDYMRSMIMMNDYLLIDELRAHDKASRQIALQELGDAAGDFVEQMLAESLQKYPEMVLLTHVPPFREACWYDGGISDDEWIPHFTCMAVGHAIRSVMRKHPEQRLTVYCGHTHGQGSCQPLPNVTVETGPAEYGKLQVTRRLTF